VAKKFGLVAVAMAFVAFVLGMVGGAPTTVQAQDGPNQVTVGIYINDVQEVDLENHHYLVDFYLWFRWTNPELDPASTIEVMNSTESWGLMATPAYEEPLVGADGTFYNIIHYQGKFNNKLPLNNYPFDKQNLVIEFEDNSSNVDALVYVADTPGVTFNPDMSLPGWTIGEPALTVFENNYTTTFGLPGVTEAETYSRFVVSIPVHRPAFTSGVKLFFPLALVLLTAVLTFFLRPSLVEPRIGTAITALLTLVALQFTVNDNLPTVEYLMMIDIIYALSYLFVLFTLGTAIYSAWTTRGEDSVAAVSFDRRMMVLGIGGYLLLVLGTVVFFLS
jgi:hypothetical protein